MRIATNTLTTGVVYQIQQLIAQQAKLQGQVAGGQSISQPSDNPAAAGRVLGLQSRLREVTQYGQNATAALATAQASAAGLQSLHAIASRAGELATLGTGVLGATALSAYGSEANQLIEQAVQDANATANGSSLFAGTAVDTPPISVTRDAGGQITAVTYVGDNHQASVPISSTGSVAPGTTGATNAGIADFINRLVSLRNALNGGDTAAVNATQPALSASDDLLVNAVADNGGVQTRIQANQTDQTASSTNLTQQISNETSTDMAATITQLTQAQTAYQAALQSSSTLMHLSLLDYIH